MTNNDDKLSVFVTVGTDHHQFNRLIRAMDHWCGNNEETANCFMQIGTSNPPNNSLYKKYLTYDEMEYHFKNADIVVCHGGPATIMLSKYYGILPIVVPRNHDYGEHVDNHQVFFTRRIAKDNEIILAEDEESLYEVLGLSLKKHCKVSPNMKQSDDAIDRFSILVEKLLK